MSQIQVVVIAFDGISPFHLSVPGAVFGDALEPKGSPFCVKTCSFDGQNLTTTADYGVVIRHSLEILESADLIVIPSWNKLDEAPPAAMIDALIQAHQRGTTLMGLCLGAYPLAATGLLDGHKATTHWQYCDHFSQRFSKVHLDPKPLYVEQGQLITSAGTVAAIDCCLQRVRHQFGARMANQAARALVAPPFRQGGQKQYIDLPLSERPGDQRLTQLMDWICENLQLDHNLDGLAEHCLMSRRTFTRHFKKLTGTSVGEWLLRERLKYSQELLEGTRNPVSQIGALAGFGSEAAFRQRFKQAFGVSPSRWRASFNPDP